MFSSFDRIVEKAESKNKQGGIVSDILDLIDTRSQGENLLKAVMKSLTSAPLSKYTCLSSTDRYRLTRFGLTSSKSSLNEWILSTSHFY